MGLLDDAIREHLEFKRLRGADPGEVAREERDALGPVRRDEEVEPDGHEGGKREPSHDDGGSSSPDSEMYSTADSLSTGQETIEINMEAELAAGSDPTSPSDAIRQQRETPIDPAHLQGSGEESLEWEMPGGRPEGHVEAELPGDEPRDGDDNAPAERLDDVLEETPDFLRDTPEQERLWFEQRPPRDFDFNE